VTGANSATREGAEEESRAGMENCKEKDGDQARRFATNSGRRLLNDGTIAGAISQVLVAIRSSPKLCETL